MASSLKLIRNKTILDGVRVPLEEIQRFGNLVSRPLNESQKTVCLVPLRNSIRLIYLVSFFLLFHFFLTRACVHTGFAPRNGRLDSAPPVQDEI